MRVGQVVIGANYGDEGKGLLTDYLASADPDRTMVVRFNGGAQAGHTVVTPAGQRHVFGHFGAGSLLGCSTYLTRFFIVNPLMFMKEHQALLALGCRPKVLISSDALVTTPFDMFINQSIEQARGRLRHGSCGLGINETVTRCLRNPALRTTAGDIYNLSDLVDRLGELGKTWLPSRLQELGFDLEEPEIASFLAKRGEIIRRFADDVQALGDLCQITPIYPTNRKFIFEGAQGLMLDEDRIDQWPYVTRSKTGLTNVIYLAPRMGIEKLDVTYVTRSYLTRHGAGPLVGESDWRLRDDTNIPNQFQGQMRFAALDQMQLGEAIRLDLACAKLRRYRIEPGLAITCCDQVAPPARLDPGIPVKYRSFAPSRRAVENYTVTKSFHKVGAF